MLAVGAVAIAAPIPWVSADTAADYLLSMWTVLAAVFTVLYGVRSRWRATAAGRALLYIAAVMTLVGAQVCLSAWVGADYPGREVLRTALYLGVAVTMLNMLVTLYRVQRDQRQER